jgi:predicted PurR-regulated permease PerM
MSRPPHNDSAHHDPAAHYAAWQSRQLGRIAGSTLLLAIVAAAAALWVLQGLLTPLLVALFLMIIVDLIARQVLRIAPGSPEWLRVGAAFVVMILALAGAVALLIHAGPKFGSELGNDTTKLEHVIDTATAQLGLNIGPADVLINSIDIKPYITKALGTTQHLAEGFLFVVIYLGFLLAARGAFREKVHQLFPDKESRGHAERVFTRVRKGAEDYIGLQTLKAVVLAGVSWVIMASLGLHNAELLAFLVLLVAYIPILGPAAAVVVPTILAVLQFDLTWRPLVMYILLQGLVVILDSILLPKMQAEKLDVDPVIVLLSLGFWSIIFGVAGALLSTPLTVVIIAVAGETKTLRWLAVILSKSGLKPEPPGEAA